MNVNYRWFALLALAISAMIWAQDIPKGNPGQPPRSDRSNDVESSSNDTRIDTSPPPDDAKNHPNSDVSDVMEFHAWDPHKAQKAIEVGDYYFKRENYHAAASRYQEALGFKPKDAEATLKLAEALEKLKMYDEARDNYTAYLKIIPRGKEADEARKALERMPKENGTAAKH
jgi:tetratricopeptide (TPR) repeat protein